MHYLAVFIKCFACTNINIVIKQVQIFSFCAPLLKLESQFWASRLTSTQLHNTCVYNDPNALISPPLLYMYMCIQVRVRTCTYSTRTCTNTGCLISCFLQRLSITLQRLGVSAAWGTRSRTSCYPPKSRRLCRCRLVGQYMCTYRSLPQLTWNSVKQLLEWIHLICW